MISFYTRALLLLRRPLWRNKHGATTRTTRRACRVVTQQVEFGLNRNTVTYLRPKNTQVRDFPNKRVQSSVLEE